MNDHLGDVSRYGSCRFACQLSAKTVVKNFMGLASRLHVTMVRQQMGPVNQQASVTAPCTRPKQFTDR
jgi:hypothetical protein